MAILEAIRQFHRDLEARAARHFRTQEIVRVMSNAHSQELSATPGEQWGLVKQRHTQEIQAVRDGQFDIVDRRTWQYPYLPEALHRLNQPILKNCFSADTQVLTKRGWVPWPEARPDDLYATRSKNGEIHWQHAKKFMVVDYSGPMVHLTGKCLDFLVTPHHRMYGRSVRWAGPKGNSGAFAKDKKGFQFAKDVAEHIANGDGHGFVRFEVPLTSKAWIGKIPFESVTIKTERCSDKGGRHPEDYTVLLEDWVAFLGLYLAEGHCESAFAGMEKDADVDSRPLYVQAIAAAADGSNQEFNRSVGMMWTVGIAQERKSESYTAIAELLGRLPFHVQLRKRGFRIQSKALHEKLHPLGNTYTKYVPTWVKNLPPKYLKILLHWFWIGDGSFQRTRMFATASQRLANDIQEILIKLGTGGTLHTRPSKKMASGRMRAPFYCVYENLLKWSGLRHVEVQEYSGKVYCVGVPDGVIYVRRNGKAAWCGQTPYNLRRFSETPIPRRAINLIKNAVLQLKWDIEAMPDMENEGDPKEREKRIRIVKNCFEHPNNVDSFRTFSEAVLEDTIIGGYGCIEPRMTPYYKRPMKMWSVDGSTIRIYADWSESNTERPRFAQMTGLKGERGVVAFLADELVYIRDNVRANTPFGLGKLEVTFNTVNALLGVQDMASKAGSDQVHKTFLWWEQPQNQAHIQTVRRHIQNELEGQAKVSLIAGMKKPEVIPVQSVLIQDLLLEWLEMLIRCTANGFDLSPFSLGLEKDVNRSTGLIMSISDFKAAVVPMATRLMEAFTRELLHGFLGWKDLQFVFKGLDDPDALTKVQIQQRQYQSNALLPDEMRESDGKPPLPDGWGKLTFGMMNILIQEAMALARAKSMPQGGGAGAGGNGGGGMGVSSGLPPTGGAGAMSPTASANSGGMRGFQGSLIGQGEFSSDDIQQMTPEEVQYFQEMGMLPETGELGQQMETQQPGVLEQLNDELKEFFEQVEKDEQDGEEEPEKVSKADERGQVKKFQESLRKPTVVEQYLNDRYRGFSRPNDSNSAYMPGEQKLIQKGKRGKYPRSGGDTGSYQ
jgi:hypothetical protein